MVEIKAAAITDEILDSPAGMPLIICSNAPRVLRKKTQHGYQQLRLNTKLSKILIFFPPKERTSQIEAAIKSLIPTQGTLLISEFEMLFDPRYKIDVDQLSFNRVHDYYPLLMDLFFGKITADDFVKEAYGIAPLKNAILLILISPFIRQKRLSRKRTLITSWRFF